MKKVYMLFSIFIILLCTGCTKINYTIRFEKEINENIIVDNDSVDNSVFNADDEGYFISPFESFFENTLYDFVGGINGKSYASKSFESIEDLKNSSIIFTKLFDDDIMHTSGSKVKINIDVSKYPEIINEANNVQAELSAYIPYYVSSHNADKVSNNTYTWEIKDIEKAKIKINFDMSKSYKYKNNLISIYITIGLFVIIVGVVVYFVMRNKKANEL